VHGAVGEQNQDGRADVATLASPASAPTATRAAETEAAARVEAEAPAAGPEPGPKARSERAVAAGAVLTKVFAEFATGVPPLLVQGTSLLRVEPESESESAWLWCEWIVHGESPYLRQKRPMRFRYVNDISESIVMQR
jgi:hypothetical protein